MIPSDIGLGTDKTRQNWSGVAPGSGHAATRVGTLLQHTKANQRGWLTIVSSPADLSCPSWARAEGDLLGSSRTLLIQRGLGTTPNSSNLQLFTRVRVTRCWSLPASMLDFALLYSHKCPGLLTHFNFGT